MYQLLEEKEKELESANKKLSKSSQYPKKEIDKIIK